MTRPAGFTSVMALRRSPPKALDYFPTPPWATRALIEILDDLDFVVASRNATACDPACGGGHMALVLEEFFARVAMSDVFDYGWGHPVGDFLDDAWADPDVDWIITNPPYSAAERFAQLALARARRGVALLVRTAFVEGGERFRNLFGVAPPTLIAPFVERTPMVKGRWNPKASSATSYSWFIWMKRGDGSNLPPPEVRWIPPGTRDRLWLKDDVRRFATPAAAPLFDGRAE